MRTLPPLSSHPHRFRLQIFLTLAYSTGNNNNNGGGLLGLFRPRNGFGIPGLKKGGVTLPLAMVVLPVAGYPRCGVIRPTVAFKEKGPCYNKKLTCPAKCFGSYSRSGKGTVPAAVAEVVLWLVRVWCLLLEELWAASYVDCCEHAYYYD
ncbi:hypothetical protein K2173_004440 [Erythroxylum novogranatense]|uniref:Uncharacterized protein n=1 Tax=Erythroxylum novogranatense TaxID=1862640 RepID=A0AAV8T5T1_9ROSI|nr:hypothetical protein K2173_004440 [Erythroxylum novogranatense]